MVGDDESRTRGGVVVPSSSCDALVVETSDVAELSEEMYAVTGGRMGGTLSGRSGTSSTSEVEDSGGPSDCEVDCLETCCRHSARSSSAAQACSLLSPPAWLSLTRAASETAT